VVRRVLTKKEIEEQKKQQKIRTSALRAARRSVKAPHRQHLGKVQAMCYAL